MSNNSTSNLIYQFYFLFRTYRFKAGKHISEPEDLVKQNIPDNPTSNQIICYKQDSDKRLFRLTISNHSSPMNISQLNQSLLESWRTIQNYYENCGITDSETNKTSFRNAGEELLLGVTLLVIGENLTDQPLKFQMMLRDEKGKYLDEMSFEPSKTALFSIYGHGYDKTQASKFIAFGQRYEKFPRRYRDVSHWNLMFSKDSAYLVLIAVEEHENHPMFAVYGLTHCGENQTQLAELEDLLLYGYKDKGKAIILELMSPLLMNQWQFTHIDAAISPLLNRLDSKNSLV